MSAKLNSTVDESTGIVTITFPGINSDDHSIKGTPLHGTKLVWVVKSPEGNFNVEAWAEPRIQLWAQGYYFSLLMQKRAAENAAAQNEAESENA